MTVNANTPCHFTRGLDHGCKMFEFTNIARSMRSRTLVAIFASSRKCISLYIFAVYLLEFTNIVQSIHSRTFVVIFASTCECISLYQSPYICFALLA